MAIKIIKKMAKWAATAFVACFFLFVLFLLLDVLFPTRLPGFESGSGSDSEHGSSHSDQAQAILSESGEPLRLFATESGVWRYRTTLKNLSPVYLKTLLAYEDEHFYRHPGVNPLSLARATGQWITNGRVVSGGSTITMQVARLIKPMPRTIWGKAKQMFWALQLEWHHSKDDILTYYINHAPFGGPIEGVEAAAHAYFGYSARDLTHAQAALLAVLPQAPSRYRPDMYPERAKAARDKVIERVHQSLDWTTQDTQDALSEPVLAQRIRAFTHAPLLARRLRQQHPEKAVVRTYIDYELQLTVEEAVENYVRTIDKDASGAVMVMDNKTGKVRAYVGSDSFLKNQRFGHVDMIKAWRSPGSTLKPFIYGMAIDQGLIHSHSLLMDIPTRFGQYQPDNFDTGFNGPVSVANALKKSLNVPAVQILDALDPLAFYSQLHSSLVPVRLPRGAKPNLSIALGGVATRLEDLVALFASLGNGGETVRPRYHDQQTIAKRRLMSADTAWVIRQILPGDEHHRQTYPSQHDWVWKTGTSYGYRDTWAIGVNSDYVIAVWIGRPDAVPLLGHYGSKTAVPLLRRIAGFLPAGSTLKQPREVVATTICWPSGIALKQSHGCDQQQKSWIVREQIPPTRMSTGSKTHAFNFTKLKIRRAPDSGHRVPNNCSIDSDMTHIDVWPAGLSPWISEAWQTEAKLGPIDARCDQEATPLAYGHSLKIRGVWDKDRIRKHAVTLKQPRIEAHVEGGQGPWHWFLNGRALSEKTQKITLNDLTAKDYQLTVMDNSGANDHVNFVIEN